MSKQHPYSPYLPQLITSLNSLMCELQQFGIVEDVFNCVATCEDFIQSHWGSVVCFLQTLVADCGKVNTD